MDGDGWGVLKRVVGLVNLDITVYTEYVIA